jgi:hypothetical protein
MYSEYELDFIDALYEIIGRKHPLYGRGFCPMAVRKNPGTVWYHNFKDGFYAIVYFSGVLKGKRGMPKTEIYMREEPFDHRL